MGTEHLLEIYVHSLSMERFISQQMKLCDPADEKRLVTLVRLAVAEAVGAWQAIRRRAATVSSLSLIRWFGSYAREARTGGNQSGPFARVTGSRTRRAPR